MKTSYVWMCYDLGIRGDYDSLFQFLDKHQAKECGDNLAAFLFSWKKDAFTELKRAFEAEVKLQPRSRIYVMVPSEKGGYKGKFLRAYPRTLAARYVTQAQAKWRKAL